MSRSRSRPTAGKGPGLVEAIARRPVEPPSEALYGPIDPRIIGKFAAIGPEIGPPRGLTDSA